MSVDASTARARPTAPPEGRTPTLEVRDAIATLMLCRPSQANRIGSDDLAILSEHCAFLAASPDVRAVILTASGKHFCAGYDLGSLLQTVRTDPDPALSNMFASMVDAVEALPQVTICAVNGGVFGGATDLALACDFRLGSSSTRMLMPAARFGLHYYASGMRRYVTRLGLDAAKRLFLLADEIDAQQMLGIGYLSEIVAPEALQRRAMEVASNAAKLAPLAVAGMKAALNSLACGNADLDAIAAAELGCLRSSDLREGIEAWHEKRQPTFRGR